MPKHKRNARRAPRAFARDISKEEMPDGISLIILRITGGDATADLAHRIFHKIYAKKFVQGI